MDPQQSLSPKEGGARVGKKMAESPKSITKATEKQFEEEGNPKSNDTLFSPVSPTHSPVSSSPPSSPSHRKQRKVQTLDFWKKRHVILELSHSLGAPLDLELREMIARLEPDKCLFFSFCFGFVLLPYFPFFFSFLQVISSITFKLTPQREKQKEKVRKE